MSRSRLIVTLIISLSIMGFCSLYCDTCFGWWNTGWSARRLCTADSSFVSATETDFVVRVPLTSSNFNFQSSDTLGRDVRFVDSDDTTPLSYEIAGWRSGSELAECWVNISTLNATTDTYFYIYYLNSLAGSGEDPAGTWSDGYAGVWHLDNFGQNDSLGLNKTRYFEKDGWNWTALTESTIYYSAWPCVERLADDNVLVSYRTGGTTHLGDGDGYTQFQKSTDNGATYYYCSSWDEGTDVDERGGYLFQDSSEKIWFVYQHDGPTGIWTYLNFSLDDGTTWSVPTDGISGSASDSIPSGKPIELVDGDIVFPYAKGAGYTSPWIAKWDGSDWTRYSAGEPNDTEFIYEWSLIEISEDNLIGFLRTDADRIDRTASTDNGVTWAITTGVLELEQTASNGDRPMAFLMDSGDILLSTFYDRANGIGRVYKSSDDGLTFDTTYFATYCNNFPSSGSHCGYTSFFEMTDNKFRAFFYHEGDAVTYAGEPNIYCTDFFISDDGELMEYPDTWPIFDAAVDGGLMGTGDYNSISFGDESALLNLHTGDFTVSCWGMQSTTGAFQMALAKGTTTGWWLDASVSGGGSFIRSYINLTDTVADSKTSTLIYPDTYYHLLMTYDTTTKYSDIYIDGIEPGYDLHQQGVGAAKGDSSNNLLLGKRQDGLYWDGGLDEVRIMNVERDADWILSAYNSEAGNLVGVGVEELKATPTRTPATPTPTLTPYPEESPPPTPHFPTPSRTPTTPTPFPSPTSALTPSPIPTASPSPKVITPTPTVSWQYAYKSHMIAGAGGSGTVQDTYVCDGTFETFSEGGGPPPNLIVSYYFRNVPDTHLYWFNMTSTYEGNPAHIITVSARNYVGSDWVRMTCGVSDMPENGPIGDFCSFTAYSPNMQSGGEMMMQYNHISNGVSGHYTGVDILWLEPIPTLTPTPSITPTPTPTSAVTPSPIPTPSPADIIFWATEGGLTMYIWWVDEFGTQHSYGPYTPTLIPQYLNNIAGIGGYYMAKFDGYDAPWQERPSRTTLDFYGPPSPTPTPTVTPTPTPTPSVTPTPTPLSVIVSGCGSTQYTGAYCPIGYGGIGGCDLYTHRLNSDYTLEWNGNTTIWRLLDLGVDQYRLSAICNTDFSGTWEESPGSPASLPVPQSVQGNCAPTPTPVSTGNEGGIIRRRRVRR